MRFEDFGPALRFCRNFSFISALAYFLGTAFFANFHDCDATEGGLKGGRKTNRAANLRASLPDYRVCQGQELLRSDSGVIKSHVEKETGYKISRVDIL